MKLDDNKIEIDIKDSYIDDYDYSKNKFKLYKDIFLSHFKSLFLKRVRYLIKDIKGMFCEIFLPIVVVIIGCFLSTVTFYALQPTLLLSTKYYPE